MRLPAAAIVACLLLGLATPAASGDVRPERLAYGFEDGVFDEGPCVSARAVCFHVLEGERSVRVVIQDDANPADLPIAARVRAYGEDVFLERAALCGSADIPLEPGTTMIEVRVMPRSCDHPCPPDTLLDCEVQGLATRGWVRATFQ